VGADRSIKKGTMMNEKIIEAINTLCNEIIVNKNRPDYVLNYSAAILNLVNSLGSVELLDLPVYTPEINSENNLTNGENGV